MQAGQNNRVTLGRTGLSVSKLCFGTSALGDMPETFGYAVDADRAMATLKAIFASPVNFLDTARIYGHGRSEERIGDGDCRRSAACPRASSSPPRSTAISRPSSSTAPGCAARWKRASRRLASTAFP